MASSTAVDDIKDMPKTDSAESPSQSQIQTLPLDTDGDSGNDLGHTPSVKFRARRFIKSLGSKDAWFGNYDYGALFIPNIPYLVKQKRELPFYGVHDKLPYLLVIILGLQHALAMVGGLVTPPLLLAGPAGAALGTEAQLYLVSACLIWCGVGTAIQVSRWKIYKTNLYFGTGLISVVGTSFAFTSVALSYLSRAYAQGVCPMSADGKTRLPCPSEFGAILGTSVLTGIWGIGLAFVPPRYIKKYFPPLITGMMLTFVGASLVKSGVTNWVGGSGPCMSDHTIRCTSGTMPQFWGSAQYIGLGFSCFATIVLCEIFGSAFMKSASVFIGLVVGLIIAAATGYFNTSTIPNAPAVSFIWLKTFPLAIRGQLVLPMIAAWTIIVAETIGNVTASADVSQEPITGDHFMSRVQGGMLADAITATLAGLATVPPLTTFSQNSGVIALTRNASRVSGFACAAILFFMGLIGKFGAIFVAAPPSVIGGFTTFLFGAVTVSGIRVMAYDSWSRRSRFIATCSFALGLASLTVPNWFDYIFTYQGDNAGLRGLIDAVVLIVEKPYLIASLMGVFLNATLADEVEEKKEETRVIREEDKV